MLKRTKYINNLTIILYKRNNFSPKGEGKRVIKKEHETATNEKKCYNSVDFINMWDLYLAQTYMPQRATGTCNPAMVASF